MKENFISQYGYLVVGSGLYGATFARLAADAGKKVLVIEKRKEVGGNVRRYLDNKHGLPPSNSKNSYNV
ncbi:MAG: NAD(P)-binding protein [Treponemataceae bacterium]|nr:NAD(P)-binding protein [Treponemataceae bacterium]